MMDTISLTPAALQQLQKICLAQQGNGLYIDIKPTGCSGYSYDLSVIKAPHDNDHVFPQAGSYFVAVSKKNLPFVAGSIIDYVREGINAKFKFLNPNETGSCGCGESFTIESDKA